MQYPPFLAAGIGRSIPGQQLHHQADALPPPSHGPLLEREDLEPYPLVLVIAFKVVSKGLARINVFDLCRDNGVGTKLLIELVWLVEGILP